MAEAVDEIVSAAWVITVEPDEVLQDHAVVVKDGKIVDILPSLEAGKKYQAKTETILKDSALLPGFVNAHTHSPMTFLRGVSDDIPLNEWLHGTIFPLEAKLVDAAFVREGGELAALEMIRGGTTCFSDMYFFPEATCEVAIKSGLRAAIGMIAIEFPTNYGSGPDDYLAKGEAMREKYGSEPRLSWTVALHAPYTCSDETLRKAGELCKKCSAPLHIHVHETEDEPKSSVAGEGPNKHMSEEKCTPVMNLKRLGLLNENLVAAHMVWLTDEEVAACGAAGVSIAHCPMSNLKLASGFCRVADLVKAGVNVSIGTDGASSNNTLDMMAEMKTAALLAKAVAKDATVVPASLALRMATLNGAKALGIDKVTGSLAKGKAADMAAVSFAEPGAWPQPCVARSPGFDPVTHIVYSCTRDQVTDVWVAGKRLMQNRSVLTLSQEAIAASAQAWSGKVMEAVTSLGQA